MAAMPVLKPLHDEAGLVRLVVSTYQAVSGSGLAGVEELDGQVKAVVDKAAELTHDGAAVDVPGAGEVRAADRVQRARRWPARSSTTARSRPTRSRSSATRAARSSASRTCWSPAPACGCRCSPGTRCRINAEFDRPLSVERATELLAGAPGVELSDVPTPLQAAGRDPQLRRPDPAGPGRRRRPRAGAVRQQRQPAQGRRAQRRPDRRAVAAAPLTAHGRRARGGADAQIGRAGRARGPGAAGRRRSPLRCPAATSPVRVRPPWHGFFDLQRLPRRGQLVARRPAALRVPPASTTAVRLHLPAVRRAAACCRWRWSAADRRRGACIAVACAASSCVTTLVAGRPVARRHGWPPWFAVAAGGAAGRSRWSRCGRRMGYGQVNLFLVGARAGRRRAPCGAAAGGPGSASGWRRRSSSPRACSSSTSC